MRYRLGVTAPDTGSGPDGPLAFAVVSGSSRAEGHLAAICDALARGVGRTVRPRVLGTYAALEEEVRAGRVHVVWAPPLVAVELSDAGLATIDLCCARGERADYHAALFTRHASSIEKPSDLRGARAAWVDEHSSAGYLVPRLKLAAEGLGPAGLFGKESFLGTHARVARAVLEGEADVGATYVSLEPGTDRPLSAGWLEAGAGINAAFVVLTAGPIPSDAIAFSRRLDAGLKAALVQQVTALPASVPGAVGRLLGADGFAPPPASHFAALRELIKKHGTAGSTPAV